MSSIFDQQDHGLLTFTDLDFFQKYVCTFLNTCGLIIIKNVPTYVHIFGKR